jgi:DNA-binding transcriptional LysR family regulator
MLSVAVLLDNFIVPMSALRIKQNGCSSCGNQRRYTAQMGRSKIIGALPRMPLQVLQYAVSIAERGSTLAAAHEFNLTSSALSRQISQLEHELGITLFERHSRGMRPTDAGEIFLDAARQVLRRMERLATDLDDVNSLRRGHVTIYSSEALVHDFLLPCITNAAALHPNITIEAVVTAGRQAEKAIIDERADIAVIFNAPSHVELEVVAESKNRLVAILPRDHPLASRKLISADELVDETRLALPPRSYATRVAFDSLLSSNKDGYSPHLTINSIASLKHYVRSGAGAAVLPGFSVGWNDSEFASVDIEGADKAGTRVCLCQHRARPLSAAARYILSELIAAFPDYAAER